MALCTGPLLMLLLLLLLASLSSDRSILSAARELLQDAGCVLGCIDSCCWRLVAAPAALESAAGARPQSVPRGPQELQSL